MRVCMWETSSISEAVTDDAMTPTDYDTSTYVSTCLGIAHNMTYSTANSAN